MGEKKYEVLINAKVVATKMDINTATILVKALFGEYYSEYPLTISIRETEKIKDVKNDG